MASLARAANISKTTLYAKFPTKAALFRAIIDQQMEQGYATVGQATGEARKTLASSLRHLAEQTVHAALSPENILLNRLIDWESPRFPEVAEMARERMRVALERIAAEIGEFAARDQIPCRDPAGAAEIFYFMVRGLYQVLWTAERCPSQAELRIKIEKIVAAFLASRPTW
jgi:TetR/AcrR family transcriptional regulator, mexJK operon transcriptional repressor